jgi:hypothetical protein
MKKPTATNLANKQQPSLVPILLENITVICCPTVSLLF